MWCIILYSITFFFRYSVQILHFKYPIKHKRGDPIYCTSRMYYIKCICLLSSLTDISINSNAYEVCKIVITSILVNSYDECNAIVL